MTFVSCLAKNSLTIRLECEVIWYEFGGDALHAQNINHNVLSRSIRDFESLCCLSNLSSLTKVDRPLRMRQVFYVFTTLTECFMPLKYLRSRYSRLLKTLLQHFQWFRSRNSIENIKFKANSSFHFFFHGKNRHDKLFAS